MRDWLDDPENRKAYERFLQECAEAEQVAEQAQRTAVRSRRGAHAGSSSGGGTGRKNRRSAEAGAARRTGRKHPNGNRKRRTSRPRRRGIMSRIARILALLAALVIAALLIRSCADGLQGGGGEQAMNDGAAEEQTADTGDRWYGCPEIDVQLLTPNQYSRPQIALEQVNGIVVHYTANPGSSAQNNRDYFENLSKTGENSVSSHFVIGIDGEIIQCIPTSEVAYASNHRNSDTISIECCHPDESGVFTDSTYTSLVQLTAWLCRDHGIEASDVIRHYDVTGKNCPKYFVEHEDAWAQFREDVAERLEALRAGVL